MSNKLANLFLIHYYINFLLCSYNIYIFDPLEFFYTPDFNFYIQTLVHDKHCICPFYEKFVKNCDKAICCDLFIKWIHIRRNNLNDLDQNILKIMVKLGTVKLVFRKFYHSAIRRQSKYNYHRQCRH